MFNKGMNEMEYGEYMRQRAQRMMEQRREEKMAGTSVYVEPTELSMGRK